MKKALAIILGLALLSSCTGQDENLPKESLQPQDDKTQDLLWDFSIKTMDEIRSKDNSFYSPMSLYLALDMLREGAQDKSLAELNELMGPKIDSKELLDYLSLEEEDSQNLLANSLWIQEGLNIKEDFNKTLEEDHGAQARNLNLSLQKSMDIINQWIIDNTRGRIDPQLQAQADMALYLVNTLYLKSPWQEPFYEDKNEEGIFKNQEEEIQVEFMKGYDSKELYYEDDSFQLARKSLKDGLEAYFIKPKKGLEELDYKEVLEKKEKMADHAINWTMPKIHLEKKMDLNPIVQKLGLNQIFNSDGQLGNISDSPLSVSLIEQLTDLLIEEEGIEAAAATIIGVRFASLPETLPEVDMSLDEPFGLLLVYKDLPLFMGEIYRPSFQES